MAEQLTRAAPALDHIPKEVVEKYQELVTQQKREGAEFERRVRDAKALLFRKHAGETQHFWTMHTAHGGHHNPNVAPEPISAITFSRPQSANYTPNAPIATRTPQQAFENPFNQLVRTYKQPVVDNLPNLHLTSVHNVAKNGNSSSPVCPASHLTAPQSNLNEQASVNAMAKRQNGLTSENTLMHETERRSKSPASRQPVVIDLVSDDDDPQSAMTTTATVKPASDPSIPSASMVFFSGSGRNTKPTQEKPQAKCKDNGKATQTPIYSTQPKAGIRATGTSPSAPHGLPLFSPKPTPTPSYRDKPQPGASTTPISAPSKKSHGSSSALSEFRAEGLGGSTHYTATLTASPIDDTNDGNPSCMEGLLATRQARNAGDACQSSSNQPFSLSGPGKDIESRPVTGRQLSLNTAKSGEAATSFKVPALPARAPTSDSTPLPGRSDGTREGTVSSQPSSHALANNSVHAVNSLRTRREASLTIQTSAVPPASTVTSTPHKRRKQVSVSSDEGSEFEPSPPSSPEGAWKGPAKPAAKKTKETWLQAPRAAKKGKAYHATPIQRRLQISTLNTSCSEAQESIGSEATNSRFTFCPHSTEARTPLLLNAYSPLSRSPQTQHPLRKNRRPDENL